MSHTWINRDVSERNLMTLKKMDTDKNPKDRGVYFFYLLLPELSNLFYRVTIVLFVTGPWMSGSIYYHFHFECLLKFRGFSPFSRDP